MASAYAQRRAAGPQVFPDRAFAGLLLGDRLTEVLSLGEAQQPGRGGMGGTEPPMREGIPAGGYGGGSPHAGEARPPGPAELVLTALPRGGVAVGVNVARRLHVPVEVLVTRKIGHPEQPELGLGAIAEGGEPVFDDYMLERVGLRACDLADVVARERDELARRVLVYRGGRPLPDFAGRRVIVVDDGLATGVTARAALRALRAAGAAHTVLAVPVASPPAVTAMKAETDEVVTLVTPRRFRSVGEWYSEFGQLTDADVLTLLAASR
jgi:putative phosphoribosyl transferase